MKRLLTCEDVANRYNVKVKTVWSWIRSGKLKASKIGGKLYRIYDDDLARFENSVSRTKN